MHSQYDNESFNFFFSPKYFISIVKCNQMHSNLHKQWCSERSIRVWYLLCVKVLFWNILINKMVKLQPMAFKILHLIHNKKIRSKNYFFSIPATNKWSSRDLKSHWSQCTKLNFHVKWVYNWMLYICIIWLLTSISTTNASTVQ